MVRGQPAMRESQAHSLGLTAKKVKESEVAQSCLILLLYEL